MHTQSVGGKFIAMLSAISMGTGMFIAAAAMPSSANAEETANTTEQLVVDQKSGLPAKNAPYDQKIAYFLWPYQWGTQNIGTADKPVQGNIVNGKPVADQIAAGEYGWSEPGTRPIEPNMKSLETQINEVKASGMTYVKISYLISSLNVEDGTCNATKVGNCKPSTELADKIVQRVLDAGLKPVVYFSQGNPDPKTVANADPAQVYMSVPSFTKQQVNDAITHAVKTFASKGIIWESWNEPDSEEHWPGGRGANVENWMEVDRHIAKTVHELDPGAPYMFGNMSDGGQLRNYLDEAKVEGATAVSSHGYWFQNAPENAQGPATDAYAYMDSEFGCSGNDAEPTETGWSCGMNPKNHELQGIWLNREFLAKDRKGDNMYSPYRLIGYDSFNINESSDPAHPEAITETSAFKQIKELTLALKGYSYVPDSFQQVEKGIDTQLYRNPQGDEKLVYWADGMPTLDNYKEQRVNGTVTLNGKGANVTATVYPQVIAASEFTEHNYSALPNRADKWEATDGTTIQAHGGSIIRAEDGTFYWVGQGAPDNVPVPNAKMNEYKNQWLFTTINMYSSKDLMNWKPENPVLSLNDADVAQYCDGNQQQYTGSQPTATIPDSVKAKWGSAYDNAVVGCKIERPHIIYNQKNKEYLVWAHWEGTVGYESSQLIAASSKSPTGPWKVIQWADGKYHEQPTVNIEGKPQQVESRDLSVWVDPDTQKGYIISVCNKGLRLYHLTDDYKAVDPNNSFLLNIKHNGNGLEAPSLFKENGKWYLFASHQDWWNPTATDYAVSTNIDDPNSWTEARQIQSRNDAWDNAKYIGQPTYALQYTDGNGKPAVLLIGDNWNPTHAATANVDTSIARYVFTPVTRYTDGTVDVPIVDSVVPMTAGVAPVYRSTFTDVNDQTPHHEDIQWMADNQLAQGYLNKDGKTWRFEGMTTIYRQDMAAFLRREAAKRNIGDAATWKPSKADWRYFTDVSAETPHAEDILWLAHAGIAEGYRNANGIWRFEGMTPIYRQDMAAFLKRMAALGKKDGGVTPKTDFTDVNAKTPHYKEIQWLGGSGIAQGYRNANGTWRFGGMTPVFRQDMAAFIHRLDGRFA